MPAARPPKAPRLDRLALLAGTLASATALPALGQHTYTGQAGDHLWCTPGNWDPPSVPSGSALIGPDVTVRVRFAGNCTPTFATLTAQGPVLFDGIVRNSGDILASDVVIQSGSFEVGPAALGSARFSMNGLAEWRTGIIARQTVRVESGATLDMLPVGTVHLRDAAMTNSGSVAQRGTLSLEGLSPVVNQGVWTVRGPARVSRIGGTTNTFRNFGSLVADALDGGVGPAVFALPVQGTGQVRADSADMEFSSFAIDGGAIAAGTGRRISLALDTTFDGQAACSGEGSLLTTAGPVRVATGTLTLSLGQPSDPRTGFTLNASQGLTVAARAALANTGNFTWTRGTILAEGSGLNQGLLTNTGMFTARAASGVLQNLTFRNRNGGVLVVDPTSQILLRDASIESTNTATLEVRSGAVVRSPQSNPGTPTELRFDSAALVKSAATPARLDCPVLLHGSIARIDDGILTLGLADRPHEFLDAVVTTSAEAELILQGPATIAETNFSGGGALRLRGPAAVAVINGLSTANDMAGPGDGLSIQGGKITGAGRLNNRGHMLIDGGALGDSDVFDPLQLHNIGRIAVIGGSPRLAAMLANFNHAQLILESPLRMAGGSSLINSGEVSLGEGADVPREAGGTAPFFDNLPSGVVVKREPGPAVLSAPFSNTGTVLIQQGTLAISGPLTQLLPNPPPLQGTYQLTGGRYEVGPQGTLLFGGRLVTWVSGSASISVLGDCDDFLPSHLSGASRTEFGTLVSPPDPLAVDESATLNLLPGSVLGTAPGGSDEATFRDGSRLGGSGTLDRDVLLQDEAAIAPGASPGELTLRALAMTGGTLEIELAGATPGTEHDRITVQHGASLGGTLRLTILNGYAPPLGSEFTVLTAATVTGEFARVLQPPGLPDSTRLRPVTTPTAVVVRVVQAADFNADGFLDFFDFLDYVTCFEGIACPPNISADFNGDDFLDFFDFDDFVAAFERG